MGTTPRTRRLRERQQRLRPRRARSPHKGRPPAERPTAAVAGQAHPDSPSACARACFPGSAARSTRWAAHLRTIRTTSLVRTTPVLLAGAAATRSVTACRASSSMALVLACSLAPTTHSARRSPKVACALSPTIQPLAIASCRARHRERTAGTRTATRPRDDVRAAAPHSAPLALSAVSAPAHRA